MLDWIKGKSHKHRTDLGKFNFFVKSQPEFIDSSTNIILTPYSNSSKIATIPCCYRWSLIKNGITIEVKEFKGSSFKCEPSDVGAIIQAEVIVRIYLKQSTDAEFCGTAIIRFGPVKFDVSLKKQIENSLSTGCAQLPVYLCSNGDQKQCQIRLFEDLVKINHAYSEANYTFDYSIFEPRVQCQPKDSCRIFITFNEKYESQLRRFTRKLFDDKTKDLNASLKSNQSTHATQSQVSKLDIKFMNRNSRDIFVFSMKAFNTKKQLRSSMILNKIEKIDFSNQQTFNYILQIQSLQNQLVKMYSVIEKGYQDKLKYIHEIQKLQKDLEDIIITYTKIFEEKFNNLEYNRDFSILSNKRDEILNKKYKHHLQSIQPLQSPMQMLPSIQSPQEKIMFTYSPNTSPFMKKKGLDDSSAVGNILEGLGQSRISSISSIRSDPEIMPKIEQLQKEKQQLQKKLQKSFQKIDNLQKNLYLKEQQLAIGGQQRQNQTAIHTACNHEINDSMNSFTQPLNYTMAGKQIDNLSKQNQKLKKSNDQLKLERQKLLDELKSSCKTPQQNSTNKHQQQSDNTFNFLKTLKKDTSSQKQRDLFQALSVKDGQFKQLKLQNQQLRKLIQKYKGQIESIKNSQGIHLQQLQKRQRKIRQLEEQIDMYRKNSDVLNRSQQLSMEMDNYNEEQIKMLKQHNEFLTNENQKLSKACEKYMAEAKQTNKLRLEIIKLKDKINELQAFQDSSLMIRT